MKWQKKRLGEMLIERGYLQESQLMQCIQEQKKNDIPLGRLLIQNKYVTEEQIIATLSEQLKIPRFNFDDYELNDSLKELLPEKLAKKYMLVPLANDPFSMICAMLDPLNGRNIERIEREIEKQVDPVICTAAEFERIFEVVYGDGFTEQLNEMLDDVDTDFDSDPEYREEEISGSASLEDMAAETPVVRMVNWILAKGVKEGASDIHLSPEQNSVSIRMRIDGKLKEFKAPPRKMLLPLISRIKIIGKMNIALSNVPQDGRFSLRIRQKEVHFRASCLPTVNGENVVLRILNMDAKHLDLDQLGFEEDDALKIKKMMKKPQGMFLTTGPTGSGKSTTLYSMLKMMNRPDVNIVTTEDPVEYRMDGIRQVELNPKAGMTFASALRSILRQDPDIIMVGEIRDTETARIAVQAAMTGHKVFSTLHTNSSAEAISRLMDLGLEPFLLASVLHVVISQRLLRRVCPACCIAHDPSPETISSFGLPPEAAEGGHFVSAVGCPECGGMGYRGRIGIYEALFIDDAIRQVIIRQGSALDIRDRALADGNLKLLRDSAFQKAYDGLTTIEEAYSKVMV